MTEHSLRYERQPLSSDTKLWRRQPGQQILWIGCSDSSCNETDMLEIPRDEVFEYRNLGNILVDDLSWNTTLRYSISSLNIRNIVICGHYGCHIVQSTPNPGLMNPWSGVLDHIRSTHQCTLNNVTEKERDRTLVELNVLEQIHSVSRVPEIADAVQHDALKIYGVVYDTTSKAGYHLIEASR